jgi:hypothetical protein
VTAPQVLLEARQGIPILQEVTLEYSMIQALGILLWWWCWAHHVKGVLLMCRHSLMRHMSTLIEGGMRMRWRGVPRRHGEVVDQSKAPSSSAVLMGVVLQVHFLIAVRGVPQGHFLFATRVLIVF